MDEWTKDERLEEVDRQFRQLGESCKALDPRGKAEEEDEVKEREDYRTRVDKLRDAINGMRSDLDEIWNEYSPSARQEQKKLASWAKDTMKRIHSAERMEPLGLSLWNEDEYGQLNSPRDYWFWNDYNIRVLVEAGWMWTRSERGDKLVGLIYLVEDEEGNHCEFLDLKGKPFTLAVK